MTLAEAWDVLAAIDEIAAAHGLTCIPSIIARPPEFGGRALHLEFWRGLKRVSVVEFTEQARELHKTPAAYKEFVEQVVAGSLPRRASS